MGQIIPNLRTIKWENKLGDSTPTCILDILITKVDFFYTNKNSSSEYRQEKWRRRVQGERL